MTEAGIRATLWAGAAGVIADYVRLDAPGRIRGGAGGVAIQSLRPDPANSADWFETLSETDHLK
jgi:hypothetical protein